MLSLFGNKQFKAFGLDISDASIKVMQLESSSNGFYPVAFANVPLPAKVINNHLIINELKLSQCINAAVNSAKNINTKYVVASIPESKSFVRTLFISNMPESEIESSLPWELEQDIPVPIDQVYLDWQVIRNVGDKMEVLVMAASKEYVDPLINSLKQAKLVPVALELDSQSMVRALIGPDSFKKSMLVLDIATTQSTFIIVENGVIQYTSSVPMAGNAFTESIARALAIPFAAAEDLKREKGLLTETKKGNIRGAILPVLDNIVDEIRNVARFFEEHSDNHHTIDEVLICGGSAKLLGISDYIAARLNLGAGKSFSKVQLGNPWVNVLVGKMDKKFPISQQDALGYTAVVGLALHGAKMD